MPTATSASHSSAPRPRGLWGVFAQRLDGLSVGVDWAAESTLSADLTDAQWERIAPRCRLRAATASCRRGRQDCIWLPLPERYGPWLAVCMRRRRWAERSVLAWVFAGLRGASRGRGLPRPKHGRTLPQPAQAPQRLRQLASREERAHFLDGVLDRLQQTSASSSARAVQIE